MKTGKRIVSIFLVVLMLYVGVPFGVFAEDGSDDVIASMYTNSYDLTGVNGVGNILSKAAATDEPAEDSGYAFSYLAVEGKTAAVKFNNAEACTLIVAVYSEETGQMLGSGIKAVEANSFETTVEIDIASMPDYFILKAFLLDENMVPLCKEYSVIEYTKQFELFDQKTVDDFGDSVIINFDEKADDNFAVLVEGATELQSTFAQNTLVSYDKDTGEYVFTNANQALTSLSQGDVFEFETNDELYLLKVKSISVSESKVTIYEDLDATHSDYFQYIDIDLSSDPQGSDMTVDMTNADDNIEFEGISEWEEESPSQAPANAKGVPEKPLIDIDDNFSVGPEWKIREKYLIGDENSDEKVKISGKIKAALSFNIRIYYDEEWYESGALLGMLFDKYFYCQVKIDLKISGSVTLTGSISHDFKCGTIDFVTPAGVVVSIPLVFHVEVSASVSIEIDVLKMTIGFKYDEDSGFQNLSSGPSISFSPKAEGKLEFKLGLKPEVEISFVKVIALSVEPECGGKITLKTDEHYLFSTPESVDYIHTCIWDNCFNGDISLYFSCKLKGRLLNKKWDLFTLAAEKTWKLHDCYMRLIPHVFVIGKCPNIAYRCDYTVINNNKKPIKNLDVKSGGPDLSDNYPYNVQNATDDNGVVSFFYPKGSYTAKFFLNGQEVATKSLTAVDTTKAITVKINTNETDGGGSGHNGGTGGSDLFNYIATFNANGGRFSDGTTSKSLTVKSGDPLTAPADPTRDNFYFAGWDPDVPATMPSKDTTFTATWSTTPPTGAADGTGSADDLSAGGTQGGIIKFGAYPQTKETDSATISALNSRASGWQSYEYYTGSDSWANGQMQPSNYMQYCDVKYGGNKYRGVTFSQYRPYYTGYTSSASYTYQDDNGYTTGTTYWFKYEPLQWKVLDPSEGLVMCVSLIDSQPYNNYILYSGTDPHGNSAYWGDAGKNHYANDYENSSLRQWLNETFYATAFTESQQNRIAIDHNHQNNDGYYTLTGNTNYTDYDSNPTNDKIFLLSYDEVLNSSYGFSSSYSTYDTARQAKGTDYAKCQGLWVNSSGSYQGNSWWWLRSPGYSSDSACDVTSYGNASLGSVGGTYYGVRPACKISNLSSGISKSGNLNPKAAPAAKAAATGAGTYQKTDAGAFQYTATGCVAGQDYILLNVTGYGDNFQLTTNNLEYIDQLTADESGAVSGAFLPRQAVAGSTTLLIGDFGSGTAAVVLTEETPPATHTHTYTSEVTTEPGCETSGVRTYTCVDGDHTYTETIPALGHADDNNDGHCDRCGTQMTGGDHCKFCGKIHNGGFFDKLTGFFHKIFAIFKR